MPATSIDCLCLPLRIWEEVMDRDTLAAGACVINREEKKKETKNCLSLSVYLFLLQVSTTQKDQVRNLKH